MLEQNQNTNEFEQPALAHIEADLKEIESRVGEAMEDKELKDLEISFNFEKIELIKKILQETQNNLRRISCLLGEDNPGIEAKIKKNFIHSQFNSDSQTLIDEKIQPIVSSEVTYGEGGERIIEGVFDGQKMIGADGKEYPVPANYASKSKLVEGDILKLTINARGNFLFKQIGPIERARVVGNLEQSEAGNGFSVVSGKKRWRVLDAPVTYFKGESGDEAVILVPKNTPSKWAAVENVIRRIEV